MQNHTQHRQWSSRVWPPQNGRFNVVQASLKRRLERPTPKWRREGPIAMFLRYNRGCLTLVLQDPSSLFVHSGNSLATRASLSLEANRNVPSPGVGYASCHKLQKSRIEPEAVYSWHNYSCMLGFWRLRLARSKSQGEFFTTQLLVDLQWFTLLIGWIGENFWICWGSLFYDQHH